MVGKKTKSEEQFCSPLFNYRLFKALLFDIRFLQTKVFLPINDLQVEADE